MSTSIPSLKKDNIVKKVFITGATGYIGGAVLHELLENSPSKYNYEITALVQNQFKADKITKGTQNRVKPLIGNLNDAELLEKMVAQSDIIINTANVDHVPSAETFERALSQKNNKDGNKTIFVHTSGTSVLQDDLSATKGPSTRFYKDSTDLDEIVNLPETQPHKPVDNIVLGIQDQNPDKVSTVIICPPTIYGLSKGYDKISSIQIPGLAESIIKAGQPVTVYSGNYVWMHVHVDDLAVLYHKVILALLEGTEIPTGKRGYYFADAGNPHNWRNVSTYIGEQLFHRGVIASKEIKELEPAEIVKLNGGFEFAPLFWGTNAGCKTENSYKVGWKPKYLSDEGFLKGIDEDIDFILSQRKQ